MELLEALSIVYNALKTYIKLTEIETVYPICERKAEGSRKLKSEGLVSVPSKPVELQ